ncbi:MAG: hypothetical protein HZB26_17445 [Candidatus Hydrogenedentes bacterium]|nr:hypothetical protein [Candidatus Hydrogenedentota bacterium]
MSYDVGMNTIHLRPAPRLAHTEYCSNDALMRRVLNESGRSFEDAWDFDFIWSSNDGPVSWAERGRTTDMGHAEYLEGGVDRREPKQCPFNDVSEVLAFDAVKEYGLEPFGELVDFYEAHYREQQHAHPHQVYTGGYYRTLVSGAIDAFGWEMLLMGAADLGAFERVLDSIYQQSLHHYRAWAETSVEVFISHDDMVWSQGPFLHPDFYRSAIFPRYRELWKPLKAAGKKVLFCSDANWTMFLDDIAEAGADGFIFEPMVSLDAVVERFGKTHCIVGSKVDCRTLTYGSREEIQAQIDATLELAFDCPGFMCAVGNHIPSNVPVDNALFYLEYLRRRWRRDSFGGAAGGAALG